ncbi:MAG: cellulase family glycosylhydrolase [Sedimentisphaerales bacterium]|nr:cellulase family glycosylhydrolase [Sedimentisphaerales bacterium]
MMGGWMFLGIVFGLIALGVMGAGSCQGGMENFITVAGDKLMDGDREYRFISYNIPNLHYKEDVMFFDQTCEWRWPDEFEIADALESIRQMGGRATRLYTLSVRRKGDTHPVHVEGPGQFNEEGFRALDKVLQIAEEKGIRVIFPLLDSSKWWGGVEDYAAFRAKDSVVIKRRVDSARSKFWTDPELIADFKKTIDFTLNRKNVYTGVAYKDCKAILMWETGNELCCPVTWTHEIAKYIKSIDSNHVVMDGFFTTKARPESIENPYIDVVSTHHYPSLNPDFLGDVKATREMARDKKAYIVGEFGFVTNTKIGALLDYIIDDGVSGAMIWSLRSHKREGGFYWHSEPDSMGYFRAYHWPGFDIGDGYYEKSLLTLMRQKAFEIQGLSEPPVDVPAPPKLLPIEDVTAISWQGSTGAAGYDIERAASKDGPWERVGVDISDADVEYGPLFNDTTARIGNRYFYRVIAKNTSGLSAPSNLVESPVVEHLAIADELRDYSLVYGYGGAVELESKEARRMKEDSSRVKGAPGGELIYQADGPIRQCVLETFFKEDIVDFEFSFSRDGRQYEKAECRRTEYDSGDPVYGYFKPVKYEVDNLLPGARWFRIVFGGDAQIGRVRIYYGVE